MNMIGKEIDMAIWTLVNWKYEWNGI